MSYGNYEPIYEHACISDEKVNEYFGSGDQNLLATR